MRNWILLGVLLLLIYTACKHKDKQTPENTFVPRVTEAKGYIVPKDSITEPKVIFVDEGNLPKIPIKSPKIIPANTNIYLAGNPKTLRAGNPKICISGQDSFSTPKIVHVIDKPFIAGLPQEILVKDAYIKDYNPQNFSSYNKLQGLKHDAVRCIMQDNKGNLWFGTGDGASKYDGKFFTHFTENEGLCNNLIYSILEDKNGNIWFGTDNGVSKYDGIYITNYADKEGLLNNTVYCVYQDKKGNIWLGTESGVCKYDGESNLSSKVHHFTYFTQKEGLCHNVVLSIIQDTNGNMWFGTEGGGVSQLNSDEKSFTNYTIKDGLCSNYVSKILQDKNKNLWFITLGGGVSRFDGLIMPAGQASFSNFTKKEGLSENMVWSILQDKDSIIWFGTIGGGISKFDGKYFTHFTENEGLTNNNVWSIFQDRSGNIWFGTEGGGVSKYDGKLFTHFTQKEGLSDRFVYCIFQDESGNLWFGTQNGVNKYDGKSFTQYINKEELGDNRVHTIIQDKSGNIWFGTRGGGVSRLSQDGKFFVRFTNKEGLIDNMVWYIFEDKEGNIWFATGGGVSKYDGKSFTNYSKKEGLCDNRVCKIIQDKSGDLWFATTTGVSKFDGKNFIWFTEKEGLSSKGIHSMIMDKSGNIWFGTVEGIYKYDGKNFIHFTEKEGLSNNTVLSMLQDRKGDIWFGTRIGLSRLTMQSLAKNYTDYGKTINEISSSINNQQPILFKNYGYEDGFLGIGCNRGAIYEDNKNIIWIGSNGKLTAYHPEGDEPDTIPPNIQLTGISLFNERIDWGRMIASSPNPDGMDGIYSIKDTSFELNSGEKIGNFRFDSILRWYNIPQNLSLAYNNNYISFNFIGITTKSPQNVRYKYILEGFTDNWSSLTNRTEAIYTNLPSGNYIFRVRAMNSDGYWSNDYNYSFTIRPPWWKTWWFRSSIIILSLILIYIYLKRHDKKKNEKLLQELKIAEQTNTIKDQFLANMSHELRTPLNGIIGMAELLSETMVDDTQLDYLNTILVSSDNLLNIINDVLDLSKIESGKMQLFPTLINTEKFKFKFHGTFEGLIKDKPLRLLIECGDRVPEQFIADEKLITQVINNLMSNAVKFTKEGIIKIRFSVQKIISGNKIIIKVDVIDNGIGIKHSDKEKLFTKFSQIDSTMSRSYDGTGLGLVICKELVQKMNGEIGFSSEENKGSTFWFTFEASIQKDLIKTNDAAKSLSEKKIQANILMVEDKFINRKITGLMLENLGCTVEIAENGLIAVEKCEDGKFDMILMDIQMPVMDGITATREIKGKIKNPPPIVGLSACAMKGDAEKYMALGMDDYMTKPVTKEILQDMLLKWIKT